MIVICLFIFPTPPCHPQPPPKAGKFYLKNETKENTRDGEEWCAEFHLLLLKRSCPVVGSPLGLRGPRAPKAIHRAGSEAGPWQTTILVLQIVAKTGRGGGDGEPSSRTGVCLVKRRGKLPAFSLSPRGSTRWRRFVRLLCSQFFLEPCDPSLGAVFLFSSRVECQDLSSGCFPGGGGYSERRVFSSAQYSVT